MKRLFAKLTLRDDAQIEKETLEKEIADAQNALEWSLRF